MLASTGGRRRDRGRRGRASRRWGGDGLNEAGLGALAFPVRLAKRANVAEAALLTIDPLEQGVEQKVASEDAECQEDCQ